MRKRLAKTKTNIKTVLLDQKIMRGVGNAYADEILWHARISPFSVSSKIPEAKLKDLVKAIKSVLEDAEKISLNQTPTSLTVKFVISWIFTIQRKNTAQQAPRS
ncbi:hypothetical protein ACRQ5D_21415 [Mucilaginibacter sp. P25]|uniref:hypothetical protein n=1 Tax=Mucilaginibacter sp. P25 TaxID=3423945 RepID=UPI003D7C1255